MPVPARPAPKQRRASTRRRSRSSGRGCGRARTSPFGTSYPIFGHFPVSIAGKTGTAEKVVSLPGYVGLKNQSWWCGYGPTDDAKLVVCAVIENGGHGGTAAAPAAAQVFASYFHVKVQHSDRQPLRLMGTMR